MARHRGGVGWQLGWYTGHAMQGYVEGQGFHLLRAYTGHGLGRGLCEEPTIPSIGRPGTGACLADGLVLTIEPIVVASGAGAGAAVPDPPPAVALHPPS